MRQQRKKKPQKQESHFDDCGSDDGLIREEEAHIAILEHRDPIRAYWYEADGNCGDNTEVPDVLGDAFSLSYPLSRIRG